MCHKGRMARRMWVLKTKAKVRQVPARPQNLRKREQRPGNIGMLALLGIKGSRMISLQRLFQKFKLLRSKRS